MSAPRPIPGRDQHQQQQQQPLKALAVWQPSVPNMSPPKSANIISGPLELKTRDPLPLLPPVPSASYPSLTRNGSGRHAPTSTLRHQSSNPNLRHKTSQPLLRGAGGSNNESSEAASRPWTPNQMSSSLTTPDQSPLISNSSPLRSHSPAPTSLANARSGGSAGSSFSHSSSPSQSIDGSGSTNMLLPTSPGGNSNGQHQASGGNSPLQRSNSRVQYTSPLFRSSNNNSNNNNQYPSSSRSTTASPALSPSSSPGLRRQGSILKNAPKDAPYLHSSRIGTQLENLTQSWEPSPLQQQQHHQQFLQQQQQQQPPSAHVTPKSPVSGPATASAVADASGPDSYLPTSSSSSSSLAAPHDASEPHPQQPASSPPSSSSTFTSTAAVAATLTTMTGQDAEPATGHEAHSSSISQDEQTLQGINSNNINSSNAPGENAAPALLSVSEDGVKSSGAEGTDEKKEDDQPRYASRDSTNYKVPVPPSPVNSPHAGPASRPPNSFGFLSSDPSANNGHRQKPPAPPPMHTGPYDAPTGVNAPVVTSAPIPQPPHSHSRQGSQSMTSPITSPTGRRHPYHPWETILPPTGHGQDHQDDGDYEDEGNMTDGDVLSGGEDQRHRHPGQRRGPHPDASGAPYGYVPPTQQQESAHPYSTDPQAPPPPPHDFTPTRSAPQPPNLSAFPAGVPNNRQAEIQHIMYIQQQQALFLQEKAMNPPLNKKTSNGNLSGGGGDSKSKRNSRHRKKISVISDPKLLSTTNQVRTVPIIRPADDSDGEDGGTKSEYTSGGEGIKRTVRKMKKVVRHVLPQQHQSGDESDGGHGGSKSDFEQRKGGLKQLKALKSKLAKKLNRPNQQHMAGSARSSVADNQHQHHLQQHYHHDQLHNQRAADGSQHRPVQFFSEENLRSRFLAQAEGGGSQSFAEAAASLRRSNTTREGSVRRYGAGGDKEEYYSGDENDHAQATGTSQDQQGATLQVPGGNMDMANNRTKFASRTFEKDEMIEFRDASGDTFFVPKWDQDPRADEVRSVVSVVTSSSRKLERSTSNATVASTSTNKSMTSRPLGSIAERLKATATIEEGGEEGELDSKKDVSDATNPTSPTATNLGGGSLAAIATVTAVSPLFPEDGEDSDAERHRMAKQIEREILGEETESRRQKDQEEQERRQSSAQGDPSKHPELEQQQYIPPPPPTTVAVATVADVPVPSQFAESEEIKGVASMTTTVSSISTTTTVTTSVQTASQASSSNATSPRTSVGAATNDLRASVISDGSSSNVSSIGGVVNAQMLVRQPSVKRSIKRQGDDGRMQLGDNEELQLQQSTPVGLGISLEPATPTHDGSNKVLTRDLDIHGRLDAVLAQMSLTGKSLPALPTEAAESGIEAEQSENTSSSTSSLRPPLKVALPIRPLSPIKRANSTSPKSPLELFRSASIGGLASLLTGAAAAAAASSKDKVNAPLPQPPTETSSSSSFSSGPNSARSSSQSTTIMSVNGTQIDLLSAPSAPLPMPTGATATTTTTTTMTIQPPASPLPAVIARQNSMLSERQSVKSMYADSIYDYYAYDSASEHESIAGDAANRLSVISIPQQQQQQQLSSSYDENAKRALFPTTAAATALVDNKIDLTTVTDNRMSVLSTRSTRSTRTPPPPPSPSASIAVPSPTPGTPTEKGEEQHVHFEDLPRAVPFRMSMMTTVAVDQSDPLIQQQHPLRPPRHPMRQSRLSLSSSISSSSFSTVTTTTTTNTNTNYPNTPGSHGGGGGDHEGNPRASMLSMLSSAASATSDFTATDSWISKRQTRDLENWDEELEQEQQEQQQQQQQEREHDQTLLEHEHHEGQEQLQLQQLQQQQQQQPSVYDQDQELEREVIPQEPSDLSHPEAFPQSLEAAAAHRILEADVKPRHPLSISGSSSESEDGDVGNNSDLDELEVAATPIPTAAADHMDTIMHEPIDDGRDVTTHSHSSHSDSNSDSDENDDDDDDNNHDVDVLATPVKAREPRVRQRQWKRKTWDPNHGPGSGSGSYDDSDASSSSSDSATSSSDSEEGHAADSSSSLADRPRRVLSHRRRPRRRSSQRSVSPSPSSSSSSSSTGTATRGRRRTQRSVSPSDSFVSSRSRSRSLSHSRSRSRSRSTSPRRAGTGGGGGGADHAGVRQSVISSSRRSSQSSHFYFDGHSTSDEEQGDQEQQSNHQAMFHSNQQQQPQQPGEQYHLHQQEYEHN
ncbi:hypothetical protein DFQ26_001069 [Actinomortierella ambigua]|nr:hypothetical protein DFQ26_001069 [Actinomortierella ambigua]